MIAAVALRVRVRDIEGAIRRLSTLNRQGTSVVLRRFLITAALLVQKIATRDMIIRGGPKGAPPDATRITSRTGALRRSIGVDRGGLPYRISVGSALNYAAVHETGGVFSQTVPSHQRTVVFGRKVEPFTVRSYTRQVRYPARPFLAPALERARLQFDSLLSAEVARQLASAGRSTGTP